MEIDPRLVSRTMSSEEAIRRVRPGRRVLIGSGAAEPLALVDALVDYGDHLADNEIVHLLTLGPAPYVKPGLEHRFRHTAFFIGENVRCAVHDGRADFMPVFLSEIPRLIESHRVRVDVVLIQVSPPDAHGFCSLGVSVDIVRAAVDNADLVIAEVNPQMPRTHGDSFLHLDRIDCVVPVDRPLPVRASEPLDEVDRAIGRHVAALIPNGATLQMGIGRIPDAVLASLDGHRNLGVHTEMFSDGVRRLADRGVINGREKSLLPGKLVTSFVMGSAELYRWVDDNPSVEMRPSSFTNDPMVIARNDRMIAINSALAVDLTGQVAADTLMGRFFSGIGGQVDFIRGAARSRGGRPIIAMRSTAQKGRISRIQAAFEEGAGVVTSRGDVHYVVTEYGVADLWGKSIRQRALSLVEIAHPDFRADLIAQAKARRYVLMDQTAPRASYPYSESRIEQLPGGEELWVRPVRLSDEEDLQDLFYALSDDDTYRRFMSYRKSHPHEEMLRLVDLDYEQAMGLVVVRPGADRDQIIAMSRYDVDPATGLADIAFVVTSAWQGKGVGTILMRRMAEIGKKRGIAGFTADVLVDNRAMLGVFARSGMTIQTTGGEGCYHLEARF